MNKFKGLCLVIADMLTALIAKWLGKDKKK